MVGRYLSVECSGYKPDGTPLRFKASGWQARILQHEVRGPRPPLTAAPVPWAGAACAWSLWLRGACRASWLAGAHPNHVLPARHTACTAALRPGSTLPAAPRAGLLCMSHKSRAAPLPLRTFVYSAPARVELQTLGAARSQHAILPTEQCMAGRHSCAVLSCATLPPWMRARSCCGRRSGSCAAAGAQVDNLQGRLFVDLNPSAARRWTNCSVGCLWILLVALARRWTICRAGCLWTGWRPPPSSRPPCSGARRPAACPCRWRLAPAPARTRFEAMCINRGCES